MTISNRSTANSKGLVMSFMCLTSSLSSLSAQGEIVELERLHVVADRNVSAPLTIPHEELMGGFDTTLSLDQALRKLASVDTFRGVDSFTAHPTTQGIRFRNAATNATSRALVLVDGVPQNDPFGGWIYWNKMPTASLQSMDLFPMGMVPAWGNYSSGGTLYFRTRSPVAPHSSVQIQGGLFDTILTSLAHTEPVSDNMGLSVEGRFFETDGYKVVKESQRGPVDKSSQSDYTYLRLQMAHQLENYWQWTLTGQMFEEGRINGTPLSPNSTESKDLSWTLSRAAATGVDFEFVTFFQDRDFQNVFTSVNADRTSERPVLDQFSVPAQSLGAQATGYWEYDNINFLVGADFRRVEGSASERFRNLGAGFTRERNEGGEQSFVGAFVTVQAELDEASALESTVRVDRWRQFKGFRSQFDLESNARTRDTLYSDRSGNEPSVNINYTRRIDPNWSFNALVFTGFRAPSLNELYRPFRVRNDITESNPLLVNESITGGEIGFFYRDEANSLQFSGFKYFMDDMITNVFLHGDTGFDPLCGFVPGGGSCNQRQNVGDSEVQGLEMAWHWDAATGVEILFNYLFSDTEITKSTVQSLLLGKSFPLAPEHKLSGQLAWSPNDQLTFLAQVQYRSGQFDNVLNTRPIDSATQVNLGASHQISDSNWSVRVQVENVFQDEIVTAIASSGIITQAAPLKAWISLSYEK